MPLFRISSRCKFANFAIFLSDLKSYSIVQGVLFVHEKDRMGRRGIRRCKKYMDNPEPRRAQEFSISRLLRQVEITVDAF